MGTKVAESSTAASCSAGVKALGFAVGLLLAAAAAAGFLLGVFTPPRSGVWCTANCTVYPYLDAGRFFPRDYWWMLPASMLAPLFLVITSCVHFAIPEDRRVWSVLAVCCGTAAMTLIALDYLVQILAVQPSLARNEADGVAMFTQYNPHGLFLVLEDLGYLLLALAMLLMAKALPPGRAAKSLRWTLGIVGALAIGSFLGFAAHFGVEMALPFELAVITIVWIGCVPAGIQIALWFRRAAAI